MAKDIAKKIADKSSDYAVEREIKNLRAQITNLERAAHRAREKHKKHTSRLLHELDRLKEHADLLKQELYDLRREKAERELQLEEEARQLAEDEICRRILREVENRFSQEATIGDVDSDRHISIRKIARGAALALMVHMVVPDDKTTVKWIGYGTALLLAW